MGKIYWKGVLPLESWARGLSPSPPQQGEWMLEKCGELSSRQNVQGCCVWRRSRSLQGGLDLRPGCLRAELAKAGGRWERHSGKQSILPDWDPRAVANFPAQLIRSYYLNSSSHPLSHKDHRGSLLFLLLWCTGLRAFYLSSNSHNISVREKLYPTTDRKLTQRDWLAQGHTMSGDIAILY